MIVLSLDATLETGVSFDGCSSAAFDAGAVAFSAWASFDTALETGLSFDDCSFAAFDAGAVAFAACASLESSFGTRFFF